MHIESVQEITLLDDGYLQWNGKKNYGWWKYAYDQGTDAGFFFIEFSASNTFPHRRHVFQQIDDNTAMLLSAECSIYEDDRYWQSTKSRVHTNEMKVFLQKIKAPAAAVAETVESMPSVGGTSPPLRARGYPFTVDEHPARHAKQSLCEAVGQRQDSTDTEQGGEPGNTHPVDRAGIWDKKSSGRLGGETAMCGKNEGDMRHVDAPAELNPPWANLI